MKKSILSKIAIAGVAVSSILSLSAKEAAADAISDIKERGKLIVAVKADYRPYGFRDKSGNIIGIEPTLAKDVADKLGVDLQLVPVVSSNRMQFLQQGKVDLMIATMTDKPDRRKVVWAIDPNYYSAGTNVLAKKDAGLKEWEDLRGKPVCGVQGAFYNKRTAKEFGAKIVAFKGTAEAYTALKQNRCVAVVFDDSALYGQLQTEGWEDYTVPLPTIDDAPWALAVRHGEDKFHAFMTDMVKGWHKSGRIIGLEKDFGIKNTPFAVKMHNEYK
ncbi:transporter substrate-binding domain-containing protein [Terasakiella sp. A23]|uniref:transporter substrate-binding domain-containing protein n=1 Tax=Terasakiella sp. FCG-A23 TaxID=3080561 RepID=UPI00295579F1|nr:transporter substrate-binding domain-containing protein [Terasakiella sp. A23]MDV7341215.1 transporter substrate-binding domain-containing protein [Terasakiella sp. A23]